MTAGKPKKNKLEDKISVDLKNLPKIIPPEIKDPNFNWLDYVGFAKNDKRFQKAFKEGRFD